MSVKMKKLDLEDSKRVKARDGYVCIRCGNKPDPRGLHVHHIHTRSIKATRHDDENLVTLCMGCHLWAHSHPAGAHEFFAKHLGQARFEALADRAHAKRDRV
jgi:5-methylcytosine-specific restriction endonuclease McrA